MFLPFLGQKKDLEKHYLNNSVQSSPILGFIWGIHGEAFIWFPLKEPDNLLTFLMKI